MDFEPNTQQLIHPKAKGDLRRVQRRSVDDLPHKSSMRKGVDFWGDYDNASARWNIIKRMIASSIGKPWDDVYSHILSKFKRNREADRLTLQSLSRYVEMNCVERTVGGKKVIYDTEGRSLMGGDIYIHPVTKILSKVPGNRWTRMDGSPGYWHRSHNPPQDVDHIKIGRVSYRKVDGVWYEITMKRLPNDNNTPMVNDVVLFAERKRLARENGEHPNSIMDNLTRYDYLSKYGSYSYAAAKRQLNKKELRTLIYPKLPPDPLPHVAA